MWWRIDDVELRDAEFDFSSSGGSRTREQALYAGDIRLVNVIRCANLNGDPAQLFVCEECGMVTCRSGGWMRLRRIGAAVAFIPAFAEMLEGDHELHEYAPPDFVDTKGSPLFAGDAYERLRAAAPAFPPFREVKPIDASEAVRLIQWHAPARVLGRFPKRPQLVRGSILAVSEGQLDGECEVLERFLAAHVESSAELAPAAASPVSPLEFHLDTRGYPTWSPVARIDAALAFNFEAIALLAPVGRQRA